MAVLKRFRSESKMQFYATAQKLRKDIMTLISLDKTYRRYLDDLQH